LLWIKALLIKSHLPCVKKIQGFKEKRVNRIGGAFLCASVSN